MTVPLIGESKEIKQKWRGTNTAKKSVFIRSYSGLHFPAFGQNTIRNFLLLWSKSYFWREIGYWALTPTNLEIFVIFSSFLRS